MDLTEEQQKAVRRPFIPDPEVERIGEKGGRPWRDPRDVLNGVLPWHDSMEEQFTHSIPEAVLSNNFQAEQGKATEAVERLCSALPQGRY